MAYFLAQLRHAAKQLFSPSAPVPVRFDVQTNMGRIRVAAGFSRLHYHLESQNQRGPRVRSAFALVRSAR